MDVKIGRVTYDPTATEEKKRGGINLSIDKTYE
jgi:hypothetical protein